MAVAVVVLVEAMTVPAVETAAAVLTNQEPKKCPSCTQYVRGAFFIYANNSQSVFLLVNP